jgi:predicted amidophosphoribosyltransferase
MQDKDGAEPSVSPPLTPARTRQSLPPKGSCWYCEKPLDSVRRFCGKECADAFDEEAEYTRS